MPNYMLPSSASMPQNRAIAVSANSAASGNTTLPSIGNQSNASKSSKARIKVLVVSVKKGQVPTGATPVAAAAQSNGTRPRQIVVTKTTTTTTQNPWVYSADVMHGGTMPHSMKPDPSEYDHERQKPIAAAVPVQLQPKKPAAQPVKKQKRIVPLDGTEQLPALPLKLDQWSRGIIPLPAALAEKYDVSQVKEELRLQYREMLQIQQQQLQQIQVQREKQQQLQIEQHGALQPLQIEQKPQPPQKPAQHQQQQQLQRPQPQHQTQQAPKSIPIPPEWKEAPLHATYPLPQRRQVPKVDLLSTDRNGVHLTQTPPPQQQQQQNNTNNAPVTTVNHIVLHFKHPGKAGAQQQSIVLPSVTSYQQSNVSSVMPAARQHQQQQLQLQQHQQQPLALMAPQRPAHPASEAGPYGTAMSTTSTTYYYQKTQPQQQMQMQQPQQQQMQIQMQQQFQLQPQQQQQHQAYAQLQQQHNPVYSQQQQEEQMQMMPYQVRAHSTTTTERTAYIDRYVTADECEYVNLEDFESIEDYDSLAKKPLQQRGANHVDDYIWCECVEVEPLSDLVTVTLPAEISEELEESLIGPNPTRNLRVYLYE